MANNVVSAPPEISDQINRALETLKKTRYQATAQDDQSSDQLSIEFKLGESRQVLKFTKGEWRKPGAVEQRIVDKLEI